MDALRKTVVHRQNRDLKQPIVVPLVMTAQCAGGQPGLSARCRSRWNSYHRPPARSGWTCRHPPAGLADRTSSPRAVPPAASRSFIAPQAVDILLLSVYSNDRAPLDERPVRRRDEYVDGTIFIGNLSFRGILSLYGRNKRPPAVLNSRLPRSLLRVQRTSFCLWLSR